MDFNLRHLAKPKRAFAGAFDPDAKHRDTLRALEPHAHASKPVASTVNSRDYVTKRTKLLLVIIPEWSPHFPPFNLARLSAIARSAGFESRILDFNVRAYNEYKKKWEPENWFPFGLWNSAANWRWFGENYQKDIHPKLEPFLIKCIEEILADEPDLVGFTQYSINEEPTDWVATELKKRRPNLKIAVGGSNIQNGRHKVKECYDFVVNGEGEEAILKILNQIEAGEMQASTQVIRQDESQRLNINDLPLPDYTGIDFNDYEIPNGINSELSRGCTAKCAFCEETHFFKYRQRSHTDALREIEHLNRERGTDVVWFIDSLVNGNLRELRAFCRGLIDRGIKIKWTGYSRCDGRMDRAFYQDLADSGCIMLNYGIESGSQKVLDDMNKGVTISEMEQNLRDGKEVGIWAATNWIVAFPTEKPQDFVDTMTFLWRNRNMNISNIGAGVGYGLGMETIVGQNPERYNLLDHKYMGHWITRDFALGGPHVMTRVKSFNIFLDHLVADNKINYPFRPNLRRYHYEIDFAQNDRVNEIEFENFDYKIIKTQINPFADTLVNEIWPLLRILWRTRGAYRAKIKFNPEIDLAEFGQQYNPGTYTANYDFRIDHLGRWQAKFDFEFNQVAIPNPNIEPYRQGAFFLNDYSHIRSASATRARRLAKPRWGEDGRSDVELRELDDEEYRLNQTIDFSFKFDWSGVGEWAKETDPLNCGIKKSPSISEVAGLI